MAQFALAGYLFFDHHWREVSRYRACCSFFELMHWLSSVISSISVAAYFSYIHVAAF
jgi:hypothetical protein